MDDWTIIIPAPGQVAETARTLLALARVPEDVATQRGGNEFRVPPYLAELFSNPTPAPKRRRNTKEGDA